MNIHDIDWHYVNLTRRTDRKEHVESEFAKLGVQATRFNAFRPCDWPGPKEDVARMQGRTPGAIGCYMSQSHIIRKAGETQQITAVCEDDVCFCKDLPERLEIIGNFIDEYEWDIFYLGATFHTPGQWFRKPDCKDWSGYGADVWPTEHPRILHCPGIWGTYAYLVNPLTAKRTYDLLRNNVHRSDGIDHLFIILGLQLRTFCFVPGCAWQYDNVSNIGNGVTRFSGFKRLGEYVWKDYMTDFDPSTVDWRA